MTVLTNVLLNQLMSAAEEMEPILGGVVAGDAIKSLVSEWRHEDVNANEALFAMDTMLAELLAVRIRLAKALENNADIEALEGPAYQYGSVQELLKAISPSLLKRVEVQAECHSDDRIVAVDFNAELYFSAQLESGRLQEVLEALNGCGFSGDLPADAVAEFFSDTSTKNILDYVHTLQEAGRETGFECSIDKDSVVAWLNVNAPELVPVIS